MNSGLSLDGGERKRHCLIPENIRVNKREKEQTCSKLESAIGSEKFKFSSVLSENPTEQRIVSFSFAVKNTKVEKKENNGFY